MADEVTTPVEETEEKPVETTTTETTDEKPVEEKAETEEKTETEEKKPDVEKNHFQRRQERLLRERAEYKAKAEWYEQQAQTQQQKQTQGKDDRPARDQFESDEAYVQALTEHLVERRLSGVKEELAQHQNQSQVQSSWVSKINQAREDYPDYETVMEDAQDIPISKSTAEAIQSSDLGADVAYYLAKNPDEAVRINSLSPIAAAREIGRIESYVEYEKDQNKKKVPVSKAPAPIKPVKSSSGSGSKSLEDMTPAEYIAYRNKQDKRK
jgi:hypothetical protein